MQSLKLTLLGGAGKLRFTALGKKMKAKLGVKGAAVSVFGQNVLYVKSSPHVTGMVLIPDIAFDVYPRGAENLAGL